MAKGIKTGGRKPGSKNKTSADVRQSILNVYSTLGGDDAFAKWAKSNPDEFYKIHARLAPKDIDVAGALRLEDIVGGVDNPDNESDEQASDGDESQD